MSKQAGGSRKGERGGRILPFSLMDNHPDEKQYTWRGRNRALVVAVNEKGIVTRLAYGRLTIAPEDWQARCRFWFDSFFEEKD